MVAISDFVFESGYEIVNNCTSVISILKLSGNEVLVIIDEVYNKLPSPYISKKADLSSFSFPFGTATIPEKVVYFP